LDPLGKSAKKETQEYSVETRTQKSPNLLWNFNLWCLNLIVRYFDIGVTHNQLAPRYGLDIKHYGERLVNNIASTDPTINYHEPDNI